MALDQAAEQARVAVQVDAQPLHRGDLEPRRVVRGRLPEHQREPGRGAAVGARLHAHGVERGVADQPDGEVVAAGERPGHAQRAAAVARDEQPAADHGRLLGQPVGLQRERDAARSRPARSRARRRARRARSWRRRPSPSRPSASETWTVAVLVLVSVSTRFTLDRDGAREPERERRGRRDDVGRRGGRRRRPLPPPCASTGAVPSPSEPPTGLAVPTSAPRTTRGRPGGVRLAHERRRAGDLRRRDGRAGRRPRSRRRARRW